jgi:hypothetical protein
MKLTEEEVMITFDAIIDEIQQMEMDASFGIPIKKGFIEKLIDDMFKDMVTTYGPEETTRFLNEFNKRRASK